MRPVAVAAALVALWQAAVSLFAVPPFILPGPGRVAVTLFAKAGLIAGHAVTTTGEILAGLAVGAGLGIATALAMSRFTAARRLVYPAVVASQAMPVFAIAPLLVLWFGYGLASKVVMAGLIIYFPVVSSFYDGLRRTDPGLIDFARIAGAGKTRTLWLIRVPAALPSLGSGLKIAAAVAPIGAVVGEWVGSAGGLGYLMLHANARMQTDLVFAALIVLVAIAVLLRSGVDLAVRALMPPA